MCEELNELVCSAWMLTWIKTRPSFSKANPSFNPSGLTATWKKNELLLRTSVGISNIYIYISSYRSLNSILI